MSRVNYWPVRLAAVLGILSITLLCGCPPPTYIGNGDSTLYSVNVRILKCTTENEPLNLQITSGAKFDVIEDIGKDKKDSYFAYLDGGRIIYIPDELKGSTMINYSCELPLDIFDTYQTIEAIYMAFDSESNLTTLLWSNDGFTQVLDEHGEPIKILYIRKASDVYNGIAPGEMIVYKKVFSEHDNGFSFIGYCFGEDECKIEPYTIFVQPHKTCTGLIPNTVSKLETFKFCLNHSQTDEISEVDAETLATIACNKEHPPPEVCQVEDSEKWGYLGDDCVFWKTYNLQSYEVSSVIEFDPARSIAKIKVEDHEYTRAVRGSLDFEYVLDDRINRRMMAMNVNGMQASIDNVEDFSDISLVLMQPSTAVCQDGTPPSGEPCSLYTIGANDFFSSAGATYDGEAVVATGSTAEPIHVRVDEQDRSFHMAGGPVVGTIPTEDGDGIRVEVTLDLYGQIINFAPTVVANLESHTKSACSDRTNKSPFQLYASGSFDVWDDLPSNPNEYYWYEDYGLVTEHLWGQGTHVTIPAYSMGYGVHTITLVVRDNYGITATDKLELQVMDDTPPGLTIPADIVRFLVPPEEAPVYIDIGQAVASDGCFGSPVITNDGPQDGMFGPGPRTITWTADDRAGNIATGLQKVYVSQPYEPSKCSVWNIDVQLQDSINQIKAVIQKCDDLQDCLVDVSSFAAALNYLAARIQQDGTGDAGLDSQIATTLEQAGGLLEGADADLLLSNESGQDAATLRSSAVQKVTDALGALDGVAELLYPSDRIDGVWKDARYETSSVSMNFYVQTYNTGSMLIIASPDGGTVYAFLDEDASDGFDAGDLGGMGHRLTATFTGKSEGAATLTLNGETPRNYSISRWFTASPSDGLSGIYKDVPCSAQQNRAGTDAAGMNAFVQSYADSWIAILTADARNFEVFLNPTKRQGADVDALGGGAHLNGLFTGDGSGRATIAYPDGSFKNVDLTRWYPTSSSARISGSITTASGTALDGVAVTCSNVDTVTTDGSGTYAFQPCPGWSGTVTPSRTGYIFIPTSRSYSDLSSDKTNQDFMAYEAQPETIVISGTVTTATGTGISGVLLTFSNGGGTATTDGSGNYSNVVSHGWSGTMTPSKTGYTFSPTSKSFTNVTMDQTQDFVGTPSGVTISGSVETTLGGSIIGVLLTFSNGGGTATTDGSGNYSNVVSHGWSGTMTPSKTGYTFLPTSKSFTNVTGDQTQDFIGTASHITISGYIIQSSGGAALSGVTVAYTGGSTGTDSSGYYSFEVSHGWSGTVTPSKTGYTFSPSSKTFSNVSGDQTQDFVGTLPGVTVSGLVYQNEGGLGLSGVAGVTISYTGGSTTTDSSGYYSFEVNYGWSGTLTPSKAGYDFSPASRSLGDVTSNQADQNFLGTTRMLIISGTITASPGSQPLHETTVSYNGGATTTDGSGYYSFEVPYGWSGTVTPSRIGFSFSPSSRSYSNVTSDQTNQDYSASVHWVGISGTITSSVNGQPVAGVSVNSTGYGWITSTTTDASGNYTLSLSAGTDAVVTPSKAGSSFLPPSRSYTNLTTSRTGEDFVAVPEID